jgi:hypothetical protein
MKPEKLEKQKKQMKKKKQKQKKNSYLTWHTSAPCMALW